jgi:phosphoserine phosphatase RsbX
VSAGGLITAVRARARAGEARGGDLEVALRPAGREGSHALLAVIDALGHGAVAHEIATRASTALDALQDPTVERAIEAMHTVLVGTRGAGALVCTVENERIRAGGIGNVELRAEGMRLSVALTRGILGLQGSTPQVFEGFARPGARIAIFSDGLAQRLDLRDVRHLGIEDAADDLFARHAVTFDDATLLLAEVR